MLNISFIPFIHATCPAHVILLDLVILIASAEKYKLMKFLIMQFPPPPFHLIHLRSKYSPKNPVLKHGQSVLSLIITDNLHNYPKQQVKLEFCMF